MPSRLGHRSVFVLVTVWGLILVLNFNGVRDRLAPLAQAAPTPSPSQPSPSQPSPSPANLPPLRRYGLPPSLAAIRPSSDPSQSYQAQIEAGPYGYWIWTHLPITVWLDPGPEQSTPQSTTKASPWLSACDAAIADWSRYLPLKRVSQAKDADILFLRQRPPLRLNQGKIERARHAETRPEVQATAQGLRLRQRIYLGDHQGRTSLYGTARHELGHALGLWGHSPNPGDVMYATQVATPPPISEADRQTLRWLYQQPTRLGPREEGRGNSLGDRQ